MKDWKGEIRTQILDQMDFTRELTDEEIMDLVQDAVGQYSRDHLFTLRERRQYETEIFNSLRKLDVLQELLEQEDVTEIMVNGPTEIFYERKGSIHQWDKAFTSKEKLEDVIQQIAGASNKIINESNPILDTMLRDGSRVNIVLSPIAIDSSCISIRKFPKNPIQMEQLISFGSISQEAAQYLKILVLCGYNIFISGGTGSGKTTFLNALSQYIPEEERVVTIEDSAELQLKTIKNLVRLEIRKSTAEKRNEVTIRDLIKTALRMRPDRIVVGEVRGAEALDMLQAMNTGHDGSLSTGHSNSCEDMLRRLETMVLMGTELPLHAIRGQIASGIDILVHLGRMRDKSRKMLMIAEVDGMENGEIQLHPLIVYKEDGKCGKVSEKVTGKWIKKGRLKHREKLLRAGYELEEGEDIEEEN